MKFKDDSESTILRANIYRDNRSYNDALKGYNIVIDKQLDSNEDPKEKRTHFDALRNRGVAYFQMGDYSNAQKDLKKAINVSEENDLDNFWACITDDNLWTQIVYANVCLCRVVELLSSQSKKNSKPDDLLSKLLENYQNGKNIAEDTKKTQDLIDINIGMGKLYLLQKEWSTARGCFNVAQDKAEGEEKKSRSKSEINYCFDLLSQLDIDGSSSSKKGNSKQKINKSIENSKDRKNDKPHDIENRFNLIIYRLSEN